MEGVEYLSAHQEGCMVGHGSAPSLQAAHRSGTHKESFMVSGGGGSLSFFIPILISIP